MAIPGLRMATGMLSDIGKSFSYGFDLPSNIKNNPVGAVTGFHPHIGGAVIGGVMAGYAGTKIEDVDAASAAMVGAGVGGAALPALGLAGAGAYGLGKGILNNSDKIVNGASSAGKWAGRATTRGILGPQFKGGKGAEFGNRLFNPIARHASMLNKASGNFVDITPRRQVYSTKKQKMVTEGGVKLKPLGWGVIGAGAFIGSAKSVASSVDNSRIGQRDSYTTTATPRPMSYANNAGASGDLVFALNANRRG